MNRIDEALTLQRELEKEYESSGEEDGFVYEEIGECLLALNRPAEARPYFAKTYQSLSQDAFLVEQEAGRIQRLKDLAILTE